MWWTLCVGLLSTLWAQMLFQATLRDTTGEPIPFATILNRRTGQGTLSDLTGRFSLIAQPTDTLLIRCVGYAPFQGEARVLPQEIILAPAPVELASVVIQPGANPADALIERALAARNRWDPLVRPHAYVSYNKLTVSLPESLRQHADSLPPYLFLWETQTEKTFFSPTRQRETLKAQKIVGNLPIQSFLSPTALQPLSLYKTWIIIWEKRLASPLGSEAFSYYVYELRDTTYTPAGDTLYEVAFFPKKRAQGWALQGRLILAFPDAALYSFQGEASDLATGTTPTEIAALRIWQHYEKLGDTVWFPTQLHSEVLFQVRSRERTLPLVVRTRSFLQEIHIPPPVQAIQRDEIRLLAHLTPLSPDKRAEPLSPEESLSYAQLDSLLKTVQIGRYRWLMDFPSLLTGRINLGHVNLLLRPLLLFHDAEGLRPQIGVESSDQVSETFRVRGWMGYGTYRWAGALGTPWRFGAEVEIGTLTRARFYAYDDVREATLPRLLDENPATLLGDQKPYENTNRAYAFRWEALVRERSAGLSFRLPLGSTVHLLCLGAWTERQSLSDIWKGYTLGLQSEYLRRQTLLRRGSTLWREAYVGPRLTLQALYFMPFSGGRPFRWVQADLWHRWQWGRWADMQLRLSGGFSPDSVPLLWQHQLRTLPGVYFTGLPFALASYPFFQRTTYFAYFFYAWSLPNTHFPFRSFAPIPTFHLQGAWTPNAFYPEVGFSIYRWLPSKLYQYFSSFSLAYLGIYTSLPLRKENRLYVRMWFPF
ncbi:MAG: DUF5686 and carboxypeptidase regulatory-like domain-containing protein [Bacteroidia bacterium]|nr:DUF5686 and carboxypeptidase regulatory-like domain-containing protein [Bacteroidia bacterium]